MSPSHCPQFTYHFSHVPTQRQKLSPNFIAASPKTNENISVPTANSRQSEWAIASPLIPAKNTPKAKPQPKRAPLDSSGPVVVAFELDCLSKLVCGQIFNTCGPSGTCVHLGPSVLSSARSEGRFRSRTLRRSEMTRPATIAVAMEATQVRVR